MDKSLASFYCAILVLAAWAVSSLALAQTTPCPGDVDGDERRTVRDAVRLISHISGQGNLQGASFAAADVNADGAVNVADVVRLSRHLSSIEALSPCILPSAPPVIDGFSPSSASIGIPVTIVGRNFAPASGSSPGVTINRLGGGTISAPVASHTNENIVFVVPTSAASGPLSVSVAGRSVTSADSLEIVPSSDFQLSAAPASLMLIQGESAVFSISLRSSNGFSQLVALNVSGLPQGVTASFSPPQVAAGQFSLLTLSASLQQPPSEGTFAVTASATVDGLEVTQAVQLALDIEPVTTSFMGRTVVADTLQTPLAGVTITLLGRDGDGNATGCSGQTVSDAAGNFAFTNLPAECLGAQLIRYDGLTTTFPPGEYAGVDLVYTIVADQVTESPVLIHLPRIDDAETVLVEQNAPIDQTFSFQTIPNLTVLVYGGTIFTLRDGTQPDPFPLTAISVPIDRLPDEMPASTTTVEPFIVAFQPANATASQPVAVSFPNIVNTPPQTNMELWTLDPNQGVMVVYGTGTVSQDGRQIVPDFDPATPGRRFGLVNFDWHGPRQPLPPDNPDDPCMTCPCPGAGDPVDLASGVLLIAETDIAVNGLRGGISIQRTLRTLSTQAGSFGVGSNSNYGFRLDTNNPRAAAVINLIMPDGNRVPFNLGADGKYTNITVPPLRGSVMTPFAGGEVDWRLKDGTVFHFLPSTVALGSLLESITDSNGNRILLVRNPARPIQITEVIDPVGRRLTLSYDTRDRITQIVDPIGRTVRYAYNPQGRLETVTDPEGGVTRYDYDAQNRLARVTNARGVIFAENTYDADGRLTEQIQADGSRLRFEYTLANPDAGNSPVLVATVTDGRGNPTTYRLNPQGALLSVTDSLGQSRVYAREAGTNLLLAIQGSGSCSACGNTGAGDASFTYDAIGNVLTRPDTRGTTTFTYEPLFNKVETITDPLGNVTRFNYDESGNLIARTDENGNTTTFAYNQAGQVLETIDPLGHGTTFAYDDFGNLISVTDPLGNTTTHRYDALSRRIETIDSLGRGTRTAYDKFNRVLAVTDARGNTTRTKYDLVGNRLSVTDARGNTISFAYDEMNRLDTRTDSRGNADTRSYDANGNLTRFVDRRGQASTFTYDVLNRLVNERYQDGSTVTRVYDSLGRLIRADDSEAGTFSFAFDAAGGLLTSAGPFGTVAYKRDALGRVAERQVVGQVTVEYSYDPAGNLLSAVMPEAAVIQSYDARNQIIRQERFNGIITNYTYDSAGRLSSLTHIRGTRILEFLSYAHDAVGNQILKTSQIAQPLITQSSVNQYAADSNLLQQWGPITYTHDNNGNRLEKNTPLGTLVYGWDGRNRLKSIQNMDETIVFHYNFRGDLVATDKHAQGNFIQSEQYVLDILTNQVFKNRSDGNHNSVLTGQSVDEHFAVLGPDRPTKYGLPDGINSTVLAVDALGSGLTQFQYEPFGATPVERDSFPFSYAGRRLVGRHLYHNRARYYDSMTGIFISEDPIGLDGGDINLYRYALNNPIRFNDPFGLRAKIQKPGCDIVGDLFPEEIGPCEEKCCGTHDRCYEANCCSAGSWGPSGTKDCKNCNSDVVKCIRNCRARPPECKLEEDLFSRRRFGF